MVPRGAAVLSARSRRIVRLWTAARRLVHLVVRQLLVETLPAQAEKLGGGGAVAVRQFQRRGDEVPLDEADRVLDQAAQRGLAGLLDDRGKRRLQVARALGRRQPAADVAQQQRDRLRPPG